MDLDCSCRICCGDLDPLDPELYADPDASYEASRDREDD